MLGMRTILRHSIMEFAAGFDLANDAGTDGEIAEGLILPALFAVAPDQAGKLAHDLVLGEILPIKLVQALTDEAAAEV